MVYWFFPPSQRREALSAAVHTLTGQFSARILAIGHDEAVCAASFRAQARSLGRVLHLADALVAATAGDAQRLGLRYAGHWRGESVRLLGKGVDISARGTLYAISS